MSQKANDADAKPFYNRWYFWLAVVVVFFCVGVIAYQYDVKNDVIDDAQPAQDVTETSNRLFSGELLDLKKNCVNYADNLACAKTVMVMKARVTSGITNKITIEKNYYNVADYIQKNDMSDIDEFQYWAVADTTDGDEVKIISFTLTKTVIDGVKNGNILANELSDYVDDLWVLASLR